MATIVVTWTPGGGPTAVSQKVKRSVSGANNFIELVEITDPTVSTYTDTQADDNTLYDYQVVTVCSVGPDTINSGGFPPTIYIDCGTATLNSYSASGGGNTFPEISFTIPSRTGTDVKIQSYQWKDASGTAIDYQYTVNTQNAVTGTISSDSNGNLLSWSTQYTLHVTFKSTDDAFTRECTFDITTAAQPASCTAATNFTVTNEYRTDFNYPVDSSSSDPSEGSGEGSLPA